MKLNITDLLVYIIPVIMIFASFLFLHYLKNKKIETGNIQSETITKRNFWDWVVFVGGLLMISPFLAILTVGLIMTPLFKTDSDLGFVWSLMLLVLASPTGLVFLIVGLIGSSVSKKNSQIKSE